MDSTLNTPVPDLQTAAVKQETSSPLAHSNQQPAAPAASSLPVPSQSPVQQQQTTQHQEQRPPAQPNYQSPAAYPSPGMTPNPNQVLYYPAPQAPAEYRPSPDANGSLPLPSMRSLDPQQTQQQQPIQGQPIQQQAYAVGGVVGQLPPPVGVMPHYYGVGQTLPHPGHAYAVGDPNAQMRYALPPTDHRVMSGGRHKKVFQPIRSIADNDKKNKVLTFVLQEIKRRTKTGCLTCRKRRIKVRCHNFIYPRG